MPGVIVSTSVRTGPVGAVVAPAANFFVAGYAERGPVDSYVSVTSVSEFQDVFGGRLSGSNLYDTIATFFEEGGARAYVARVIGGSGETGSRTSGSLTLTAKGPGAWADDLRVRVITADSKSTVKVYYPDANTLVYTSPTYDNVADLVNAINGSRVASLYVTASASSSSLPTNMAGASVCSGGVDDNDATISEHAAALDLFIDSLGAGAVSDVDDSDLDQRSVHAMLLNHGYQNNRIAILHSASDDDSSAAIAASEDASTLDYAEYGALYYPWVKIPDGVTVGGTRTIPADGYVAAKRSRAHVQTGAWAPAAGLASVANYVSGLATEIGRSTGDALNTANVNAIRVIQGSIRIYGARSVSADSADFKFITARDVINYITVQAKSSLEDLVFGVLDGRNAIFAEIASRLTSIIEPIRIAGGLYEAFDATGKRMDYGYTVKCDNGLNPASQLAEGTIKARVGLRVSTIGELIQVDILKSNISGSLS
jgi:hypothetical protein